MYFIGGMDEWQAAWQGGLQGPREKGTRRRLGARKTDQMGARRMIFIRFIIIYKWDRNPRNLKKLNTAT